MQAINIPLTDILSDPAANCRGYVAPSQVIELVEDIKKRGLDTPITVEPYNKEGFKYRIVMGHCRYLAFKVLKNPTIPAFIREFTALERLDANLNENVKRNNLNMVQEANTVKAYIDLGLKPSEVRQRLGKSTEWIEIRLELLKMNQEIQDKVVAGLIKPADIKLLSNLKPQDRINGLNKLLGIKQKESAEKVKKPTKNVKAINCSEVIKSMYGDGLASDVLLWFAGEMSTKELKSKHPPEFDPEMYKPKITTKTKSQK